MRRAVVAVCVALAVAVAGCGGSSSGASRSGKAATATATVGGGEAAKGGVKVDTAPDYVKPSSSAPVRSGTVEISYRNVAIQPDAVRVRVGTTIRWTNYDEVDHNVKSESGPAHFSSPTFGKGGTFEYRVTAPGVIHYECTLQPTTMNGTIEVVG